MKKNNSQGALHPKSSVWLPHACAGRTGKSNQSISRQPEFQLLLMFLLPQCDVLLSVPMMLHLPVQIPALIKLFFRTVILFPRCYPWLRGSTLELLSQQFLGSPLCSQPHCCHMVGSHGSSASLSQACCQN